jgi:DNA ligase-1
MYKNHVNGVGTWDIQVVDWVIHITHATSMGGSRVSHTENVEKGLQSRSRREQILARVKSRINKQKDKGYVYTYKEALNPPTNTLGFVQPMLAKPVKQVKLPGSFYVQNKLDGHRCLITRHNGSMVAYSRQGKIIDTIDHILDELNAVNIPEGEVLDGELYCHGESLQTIASWAKRKQANTSKLSYHVYDWVASTEYRFRLEALSIALLKHDLEHTHLVHTQLVDGPDFNMKQELQRAIDDGYEGLILRTVVGNYEAGRRSKYLIKVKQMEDDEFKVVDIIASADGWGVLVMELPGGGTFRASAPGTVREKTEVLENMNKYMGRLVTVEYSQLTKDKVPFHPVAVRWRDDL